MQNLRKVVEIGELERKDFYGWLVFASLTKNFLTNKGTTFQNLFNFI